MGKYLAGALQRKLARLEAAGDTDGAKIVAKRLKGLGDEPPRVEVVLEPPVVGDDAKASTASKSAPGKK